MLESDPIAAARNHWVERGWPDAAPGMAVISSIVRVQQLFVVRIEQELRPRGLTLARFEVLMLLLSSDNGELSLGQLCARLQVHFGAITNAIDRLEDARCVVRRPHPTDGRTTMARITPKGRSTALTAAELLNQRVYENLGLSVEKLDELYDALKHVRCIAGDFPAGT
jgi:DNA-binding MarR family transcriptional regulator